MAAPIVTKQYKSSFLNLPEIVSPVADEQRLAALGSFFSQIMELTKESLLSALLAS